MEKEKSVLDAEKMNEGFTTFELRLNYAVGIPIPDEQQVARNLLV